jgi:hypothetical protein
MSYGSRFKSVPGSKWSAFTLAALLVAFAFAVSACGGGSSSGISGVGGFQEGEGAEGDSEFSQSVILPYYQNNNLIDPDTAPDTSVPSTVSNLNLLTVTTTRDTACIRVRAHSRLAIPGETSSVTTVTGICRIRWSHRPQINLQVTPTRGPMTRTSSTSRH